VCRIAHILPSVRQIHGAIDDLAALEASAPVRLSWQHIEFGAACGLSWARVSINASRSAVWHIASWTDVELEGGPAPPTPENIAAVMNLYPVGERFFQEFTLRQVLLNAAKNGCGPSAAGTSSRAEGPNTAKPAGKTTCPVPEVNAEPTGASALTASTP
jgi:hypothetical protein